MVMVYLLLCRSILCQVDANAMIQTAEKLYQEKKYKESSDLLLAIEPKSASIWYNCAVVHLSTKNYLTALVCATRAEQAGSFLEKRAAHFLLNDIMHCIDHSMQDNLIEQVVILLKQCILSVSIFWLQLLILLCSLLFCYRTGWLQKKWTWYQMGPLLIFLLLLIGWLRYQYEMQSKIYAFVQDLQVPLKVGPAESFYTLKIVDPYKKIEIIQRQKEYVKAIGDFGTGWIDERMIEYV